tara:strand:- start:1267 stop:2688 length:1422 start_codon:yes stop_codon:yes gene_type:complete
MAAIEELLTITHATVTRSRKGEDRSSHFDGSGELSCFLVADGHGGPLVAEYASKHVLEHIQRARPDDATVGTVMHDAFVRVHAEVKDPTLFQAAGCTCTVVGINKRTHLLTCANVGDSQSILVLPDGLATPLSVDHRLEANLEERERIERCGGRLGRANVGGVPGGPLRVWPGGLAMSRALGDPDCEGTGVVAEPSVSQVQMPPEGGRVVLCSDGVWDALSVEQVAKIVRKAASPAAAAETVVARAIKARGLRDDTTCTVAAVGAAAALASFSPTKHTGMCRNFSFGSMSGMGSSMMGRMRARGSGDGDGSSSEASDSDCSLDMATEVDDSADRDPSPPQDESPSVARKFGNGEYTVKGGRLFANFASWRSSGSAASPPHSPLGPQPSDSAREGLQAQAGPPRPSSMAKRSPESSQHGSDGALEGLPESLEGGVRSISVDCSAPPPDPAPRAKSTDFTVSAKRLWKSPMPGPE